MSNVPLSRCVTSNRVDDLLDKQIAMLEAQPKGQSYEVQFKIALQCYREVTELAKTLEGELLSVVSEIATQAWIPVSERFPEKNEMVLITHDGRKITKQATEQPKVGIGYWNGYEADSSKKWCVCKDHHYMYFGCLWPDADSIATWGEITHWMPLPEVAR